jgi:hypothetical protein
MKAATSELYALFVDDGSFAVAIVVWLALVWIGREYLQLSGTLCEAMLFFGLVAILIESAVRRARR